MLIRGLVGSLHLRILSDEANPLHCAVSADAGLYEAGRACERADLRSAAPGRQVDQDRHQRVKWHVGIVSVFAFFVI